MPWYSTVLISFFSAGLGALFAWLGIHLQLKHEGEKDRRQWARQVKSDPLLAFRKKIASIAEICRRLLDVMIASTFVDAAMEEFIPKSIGEQQQKQLIDESIANLDLDKKLQTALRDFTASWENGEFQRAVYELDNKDIIDLADQLQKHTQNLMIAITQIVGQKAALTKEEKDAATIKTYLKDSVAQIKKQSEDINTTVLDIQSLINQRLQEL